MILPLRSPYAFFSFLGLSLLPEFAPAQALSGFKYKKEVTLNTSATGANVTGTVTGFPVPINLSADNFDFAQAKADGSDLRFTKPDGSPLPFEIESWDATGKSAAVWVRTDVTGNSASQALVMHWGNPDAAAAGDSKAVFPTSDFLGVWHLGEAANNDAAGFKDATANAAHGKGSSYTSAQTVPARIGKGLKNSNALKNSITIDETKSALFNPEPSFTIFVWTNIVSFPSNGAYHTMISKGDGTFSMQRLGGGRTFEPCCWQGSYHMCAVGKMQGQTGTWYRFAASFTRGSGIKFYINNNMDAEAKDGSTMEKSPRPLVIANQTQGDTQRWWDGILDEVRVTNGARSADWIKLDYESAKEGQKFVALGQTSTGFVKRTLPGWIGPSGAKAEGLAAYDLQGRLIVAGPSVGTGLGKLAAGRYLPALAR
jgi:hypothetical protein